MQEHPDTVIPVLTEVADFEEDLPSRQTDMLVAELQTRLAADIFALTETTIRAAFAEMEASLFKQISTKLRAALPDLVDSILREHLGSNEHEDEKRD